MMSELRPYDSYKESGTPALGLVPDHWQIMRQRNVVRVVVSNVDKHHLDGEKAVRLCNYVDVYKNDRITRDMVFETASATDSEIDKFCLCDGDVVVTKDSESWNDIGVPALVEYEAPDLLCGYHLAILRPRTEIIRGTYLFRLQQSTPIAYHYHVAATGVTRYGLSYAGLKDVRISIPPLEEQDAIARFLDHADRDIALLTAAYGRLAGVARTLPDRKQSLLFEYRTRLIADVVTGKLDVRRIAADLPPGRDRVPVGLRAALEADEIGDGSVLSAEEVTA